MLNDGSSVTKLCMMFTLKEMKLPCGVLVKGKTKLQHQYQGKEE